MLFPPKNNNSYQISSDVEACTDGVVQQLILQPFTSVIFIYILHCDNSINLCELGLFLASLESSRIVPSLIIWQLLTFDPESRLLQHSPCISRLWRLWCSLHPVKKPSIRQASAAQ